jgi:hypothetical protein
VCCQENGSGPSGQGTACARARGPISR